MALHIYRFRQEGPSISELSREVPGGPVFSAAGFFYTDIQVDSASLQDLTDAMASRGWSLSATDPANTPAEAAAAAGSDAINFYDEGVLLAKRPSINFIGGGVTAVDNGGANRIDVTVGAGVSLASAAPVAVDAGAAAVGTGSTAARDDHKHTVSTATVVDVGTANAAGTSNNLARADHVHNVPFSAVNTALGAASASISVNNQKIIAVLDPTNPQDAATKAYVDANSQGLDVKTSMRAATTAALAANTRTGNVLTADANGALGTIDAVALIVGDRLLVKNEATGANNGLYTVTDVGSAGTPFILTRSVDADTSAEVTSGLFTFIEEGTANSSAGFVLTTANPITLNTTALTFTQFSGAGQIVAGAGLTKSGNTLNVVANADGSITVNADDIQVGILATDAQHGVRGGGTQHANVVAAGAAGFMTGADKTKLDNLPTTPKTATFVWGNSSIATSTTARFLVPGYEAANAPIVAPAFRVPTAGTIRNLRVRHNTVGVGAANVTYTLRKNSTNQTLACTMAATGADATDLSNTFTVAAGDLLDITVTKAASITTSPADVMATVEFAP